VITALPIYTRSSASSFLFAIIIDFGELELQMFYRYASKNAKNAEDHAAIKMRNLKAGDNDESIR
jgi:hypothetical protein